MTLTTRFPIGRGSTPRAQAAPAEPRLNRKTITDRLNLPEDASNEQIFAAVDAVMARSGKKAPVSADDALYALAWGDKPGEALYRAAWGGA